jgi:peptide-methionine (R)-S-oxide reductase
MKTDRRTILSGAAAATLGLIATTIVPGRKAVAAAGSAHFPVTLSDAQWKARLSPAAYNVLRHENTERAGSSPLDHEKRRGTFACAGCNNPVYRSVDKFDSGTGWPSFSRPIAGHVQTKVDRTWYLASRTEVHCARCGGHLGHVFDDGPKPTGKRYCMNGVAMKFVAG